MHFNDANGYKNSDVANDYRFKDNKFNATTEQWRKHLATAIPTTFPLRSSLSSHPLVDASVTRLFLVPSYSQGIILDHGIKLSMILTLAYGLVLRAHADSSGEVVFGYIQYGER